MKVGLVDLSTLGCKISILIQKIKIKIFPPYVLKSTRPTRVFWKYRPKWFSDEHSESENISAVFPEIETRILFFVSLLLFESLFWTFEVRFCGSPTPFDS